MPNYFMAFDFGMKRIGVAVGQDITNTASPLDYLPATDGIPEWESITKLLQKWQPKKLIIGIPLTMDGSEQAMTFCARKFANRLFECYKIPVVTVDERLTSVDARARLFEEGGYKALKKGVIDSMAAKIMLEDWLRKVDDS